MAKKGKPGDDSVNATVRLDERIECGYGQIAAFTAAIDILLTSGIDVDLIADDFAGYYEQWPVAILQQWFCAQLIVEEGMEVQTVGDFGYEWLPNKLNRAN